MFGGLGVSKTELVLLALCAANLAIGVLVLSAINAAMAQALDEAEATLNFKRETKGRHPMRDFNGSLVLQTPPLASARLEYSLYGAPPTTYPLAIADNGDGTVTLTTAQALPRGTLMLIAVPADSKCCPRCMQVWSDGCPPTVAPAAHSPGSGRDTGPVPSCPPAAA
jgi:hypothetical protein